jgi:uncharacterized protein (DUF433 family)
MINYINHIEANPEIMFGKRCVKETRVPVDLILRKLKGGYSYSDLLDAYRRIKLADIEACLLFEKDGKNVMDEAELKHNALITAHLLHSKAFLGDYYKNTEGS